MLFAGIEYFIMADLSPRCILAQHEKSAGHACVVNIGSAPNVLPQQQVPPYDGGAAGRLRRPEGRSHMGKHSLSHTSRECIYHVVRIPKYKKEAENELSPGVLVFDVS